MDYFPIFLNLRGRRCLVVGGGQVAARKVALLRRAHAQVIVVAPHLCATLARWQQCGELAHHTAAFTPALLDDVALVIAATDDAATNSTVARAARQRNLPVNVVDQPELCTFISPALVDRNPLLIAISTAGQAPVLARQLRQRLEQWLPASLGELAAWAGRLRAQVKQQVASPRRRYFWEQVFFGRIAGHWLAGRRDQAQQLTQQLLEDQAQEPATGEVYIVGAGPGHPDLLTLRALQLMQQADVILHDKLVSDAVLERARRDAERIFVGKQSGCHHKTQDQINQLMVDLARAGKRVCRLKGGDPLIFGRGGEEMEYLHHHGIAYQVVPGVTAAAGCAAYAGIPLTHRHFAHGAQFLTGHVNGERSAAAWRNLLASEQTLVFYMAVERLSEVVHGLRHHGGARAELPVAVVEKGTLPDQRVITGTLLNIEQQVRQANVGSPALLIVGETCALAAKLHWFDNHHAAAMDVGGALRVA